MFHAEFEKGIRHSFNAGHLSIVDVAHINGELRSKGKPVVSLKGCRQPSNATVLLARAARSTAAAATKRYVSPWTRADAQAWAKRHKKTRGRSTQLVVRAQAAMARAEAAQAAARR